ncbi:MAG TPA: CHAD domain-containing protein [Burkholderiaceae bacterium]|nr:CHAD domain-containing protein [Burkholderiaceae bacterium]
MNDSTEIELKLAVVKGKPGRARGAFGKVRLERTSIDDVYFDTQDANLRRRGLVLRLRHDGDRWLQTLKASDASHGIVPVRGEWEVVLPAQSDVPALDLERFDIAPLRVLLRKGLDTNDLGPVFRARTVRERGTVSHGASVIEVALDRGELRADVEGRRRRLAVAEVELELKSGQAADLIELAAALVQERGRGFRLVPALRTKAERGYALAGPNGLAVARASARGFADQVRPEMRSAEALRAVVRHGLAIVVTNVDALRAGSAGEHLHQARVALRRMRSAVRLFDPDANDLPRPMRARLRWLARVLGEARDWDVIMDDTLPRILAEAGTPLNDDGHRLRKAAAHAHERALARATAAVSSRRYARLVLDAARWTMATELPASSPVGEIATALLDRAAGLLFEDARSFARLAPHRRHRVRILAKRLRYAMDLLASTVPAHGAADYVESLAHLQDSLGELTDAYMALELLTERVRDRSSSKALEAWLASVEPLLAARAGREFSALARRSRPWHPR